MTLSRPTPSIALANRIRRLRGAIVLTEGGVGAEAHPRAEELTADLAEGELRMTAEASAGSSMTRNVKLR